MDEIARLEIQVASSQPERATAALRNMAAAGKQAEAATDSLRRSTQGLGSAITSALTPFLSFVAVLGALRGLVSVTRQFEVLNAQLETATGSAEGAARAFTAIKQLAKETPFDVEQVTQAFVKLVNFGLNPGREAIISYGNFASATSRSMDQLVEAVADAVQGQFRRLLDFGIMADKEGDHVTFLFRGVATTVKNTSKDIQEYLMGLGKVEFAGAMEKRAKTLDGVISNLGDSWQQLQVAFSQSTGFDAAAKGGLLAVTSALDRLKFGFESGEFSSNISLLGESWKGVASDIEGSINAISKFIEESTGDWKSDGESVPQAIGRAFLSLPLRIRGVVQSIADILFGIYTNAKNVAGGVFDVFSSALKGVAGAALGAQMALAGMMNPLTGAQNIQTGIEVATAAVKAHGAEVIRVSKEVFDEQERIRKITWTAEAEHAAENDREITGLNEKIRATRELNAARLEGRKGGAITDDTAQDPLAGFNRAPENAAASGELKKRLEGVQDALSTEYEMELKAAFERDQVLQEARAKQLLDEQQFQEERARNKEISENKLSLITYQSTQEQKRFYDDLQNSQLNVAQEAAATIVSLTEKGSAAQKAAFFVGKALAVAQAVVQTNLAALAALAPPPIGLGPVAGQALAAGIRATGYSSAALIAAQGIGAIKEHDTGGFIPAGGVGIVGERGPEFVQGPAVVTSRQQTAERLAGSGARVSVVVNNYAPGTVAEAREVNTPDGKTIEVIVRRVKEEIANDIATGGKTVPRAMESVYNLQRKGRG